MVEITVTAEGLAAGPFPGRQTQQAQSSGFVYDEEGRIVTNQHVVDGATSISVRFWNGATYRASLVGEDASTDLAVLEVDAPASLLQPLALGDSGRLAVGDGMVALGSPFGLEGTLTSGIVSALHRQITAPPNDFTINDSIQTDAAINHGNSGGPLPNLEGRVVGVNAQIESQSGGSDGVGFAIPSNTVRTVVGQIVADGTAEHAYLGVAVESADGGIQIAELRSGAPAQQAGLQVGDVITKVDGRKVTTAAALQVLIDARRPGQSVRITYIRNGSARIVRVTLGSRPS